jgi:ribose transport system ATP-binding protein
MEQSQELLKMTHVSKSFPGVLALDDIQFDLRKGEVHALVGENGAGKSTLIKILAGVHKMNSGGEINLDQQQLNIKSPHHANQLGIYTIYQEVIYVPDISVAENLFLGSEIVENGLINHSKQVKETEKLFEAFGYPIDPKRMACDLNIAELRMVNIVKALNNDVKILILDEPTASLTDKEKDILFENIVRLKKQGTGIIYISHRTGELKELADRATVFRDGKYIDTLNMDDISGLDDLIPLMIGKEIKNKYPKVKAKIGDEILKVANLNCKNNHFQNVSLNLHSGEVLGFFGLVGCGFEEVFRSVFGVVPYDSGKVEIMHDNEFKSLKKNCPKSSLQNNIAFIPRDRKHLGLLMNLSVAENIVISSYKDFTKKIFKLINRKKVAQTATEYKQKINIKTPCIKTKVETLSGGNQQKVLLARALCSKGSVFLFNQPTAGVDVGAKIEIYQFMNQLTASGAGIVTVSYELPEIMGMCDRIMVMYQGKVVKEFNTDETTKDEVLKYAFGHNDENSECESAS